MEKKYFVTPYLKVVEVKNDVIATSDLGYGGSTSGNGITETGIQERHGMWDEEFCEDDLY